MQRVDVLPCPFCGEPADLIAEGDRHGEFFQLGCSDKKCIAHWMKYTAPIEEMDDSVRQWNTRKC